MISRRWLRWLLLSRASPGAETGFLAADVGAASSSRWIFRAGTMRPSITYHARHSDVGLSRNGLHVPSTADTAATTRLGWASWSDNSVKLFPGADITTLLEEAHHIETASKLGYIGENATTARQAALWQRNLEAAWEEYASSIRLVPKR